MSFTEEIKEYALDIGYGNVGITTAESFSDHIEEATSRDGIYDFYVEDPRRFLEGAEPKKIMPSAKSIISLVWDYAQTSFPESFLAKIGRIYQARCYSPTPHRLNGGRYRLMVEFL